MIGYIKLHRQILEWEWYDDANAFRLFVHCLIEANHADKVWRGVEIKRGQFYTSIGSLAKKLKLSDKAIRIAIDKLTRTKEVATKGASNGTMITICNYDIYQGFSNTEGQAEGQTKGERGATTNNKKNKEEEKENINTVFSFQDFWEIYPNKKTKAEAAKKYEKISEQDRLVIKQTIQGFIDTPPFKGYNFPMASTYINQKRWLDDVEPVLQFNNTIKTDEYE